MDNNLWPQFNSFSQIQTPQKILEIQGKKLMELTNGLVYGSVSESMRSADKPMKGESLLALTLSNKDYDFNFRFELASKYLTNYRFQMFIISHNIDIYPLKLKLDPPTAQEIGIEEVVSIIDEDDFISTLSQIFKSDRVTRIVYNIMQLADSGTNRIDDLPF
ncbi:hypothetical protein RB298_27080 [Priestia sp. BR_2]